ncbi:MAG: efflux RND transporter periplasmic adaptor subunit [Phycisphaerae bacterium]
MKSIIKWVVILLIIAAAGWWASRFFTKGTNSDAQFVTAAVRKGNLSATVSVTGTVEPRNVVDVGAQVSGTIVKFGTDADGHEVDYDSPVNKGTVLAIIDPANYAARVDSDKAALAEAQANVAVAKAKYQTYVAAYEDAAADWKRAQKLGNQGMALPVTQYDSYKSTYLQAKANLTLGKASIVQAQMAVNVAKATLKNDEITLSYCTITSPVKGVVIDRDVDIGQTVASSFNTPSLFLLAENLKKIQVWASVNEADIGRIKKGQPVTFTVDALPGKVFHGVVSQVRLNATVVQNVVTYTVVIDTNNASGELLPYLTAQAEILVARKKNVLMVPNAALRWVPLQSQIAPGAAPEKHSSGGSGSSTLLTQTPTGTLWIADGKYVRPLVVHTGLSNNYFTQIMSNKVKPGMQVVIGDVSHSTSHGSGAVNPFIPQPFKHKKPK